MPITQSTMYLVCQELTSNLIEFSQNELGRGYRGHPKELFCT